MGLAPFFPVSTLSNGRAPSSQPPSARSSAEVTHDGWGWHRKSDRTAARRAAPIALARRIRQETRLGLGARDTAGPLRSLARDAALESGVLPQPLWRSHGDSARRRLSIRRSARSDRALDRGAARALPARLLHRAQLSRPA